MSMQSDISVLLKRGFMALEDGEWTKADDFFEQALNQNAELAEAYLGKLMVELKVKTQEGLKECETPFDDKSNYQRVLRFADDKLKSEVATYVEHINVRNEEIRLECEHKAKKRAKRNKKIAFITTPIICVVIAIVVVLNVVIIPNGKYNDAIALMDAGKYDEAISAFKALDDYKDSQDKIKECNIAILDGKYNDAIALVDAGKYDEAYNIFHELGNHKDAFDKALDVRLSKNKEQLKNAKVGDYIKFGAYEQDNNTYNGNEEIEWLVLAVKDGQALVISKYALDCKPYDAGTKIVITWESCSLRKWLNNDFINSAFSVDENAMIPTVTLLPEDPGSATQDKVFLLSVTEVNKYFSSDSKRQCKPTDYAEEQGAYAIDLYNGNCSWHLRSYSDLLWNYAAVYGDGYVTNDDDIIDIGNGVRPAMWIDISAID